MTGLLRRLEGLFGRRPGEGGGAAPGPLLFFLLLAAVFYSDKALFGPFAAVRLHDVFDSDFFRYQALASHGPLAQWYPNYAGGMPAYAWHHAPYYILALLSRFLPLWLIYSALTLLLAWAAGRGMYRLLAEHAGLERGAAAWGGALFAVASQLQPNNIPLTVFNYALPLFFCWFMDAYRLRGRPLRLLAPLLGLNAVLAVSYPVLTLPYFPLAHLLLLWLFVPAGGRRGPLAWYFTLWLGYVLACAPVLQSLFGFIPLACKRGGFNGPVELLPAAWKFLGAAGEALLSSASRSALLVPLAASLGLAGRSARLRAVLAAAACAALVSGFFSTEISALLGDTIFMKMDLAHFSWTLPFLEALAVALAAGLLLKGERPGPAVKFLCAGFLGLGLSAVGGLVHVTALAPNVFSGLLFLLLLSGERNWMASRAAAYIAVPAGAALILLTVRIGDQVLLPVLAFLLAAAGAAALVGRARPAAAWALLLSALFLASAKAARCKGEEPEADRYAALTGYSSLKELAGGAPVRFASFGMHPAFAISQGLDTADARGPVFSRHYKDYFKLIMLPQLRDPEKEAFFDSYWYNLFFSRHEAGTGLDYDLARAANIGWILAPAPDEGLRAEAEEEIVVRSDADLLLERSGAPGLKKALGKGFAKRYLAPLYAYRLKGVLPRGHLATGARAFSGEASLLAGLSSAAMTELRSAVFVLEGDAAAGALPAAAAGKLKGEARLLSYEAGRARFSVIAQKPAALLYQENYNPGWKALVDGRPVPVARANAAFMAVPVPAGSSEVELVYSEPGLPGALGAAAAGLLLINLLLLLPPLRAERVSAE